MLRLLSAIFAFALVVGRAEAGLEIFLDQPFRIAERGDQLVYTGTLRYDGENSIELFGIGFYGPSGFVGDFQSLVRMDAMAPGEIYSGDLFMFKIDSRATFDTHTATIMVNGYDPSSNLLYSDSKLATVQVVPEPATGFLLVPALFAAWRQRKRVSA